MFNDDLKRIIERAKEYAERNSYQFVTAESIAHSILKEEDILAMLDEMSIDHHTIAEHLEIAMKRIPTYTEYRASTTYTTTAENIIRRALTHNGISGSNGQNREISASQLLLHSILCEHDTDACNIFNSHGLNKEYFAEYLRTLEESEGESLLDKFCVNLNNRAAAGKIDPVIGRDKEIETAIEVLARRKKCNLIFVGEPGTGKTAVVEGLARLITEKKVPKQIADKEVYLMDIGTLVAGTKFRGEFEERLKGIMDEVEKRKNVILFIDEIHMLMGAGASTSGTVDASNMIKPAIANGNVMVIGATTYDEYTQHLEKDRALLRRFQKIELKEPSPEDSKLILRGVVKYYEEFHGVKYDEEVLDQAVDLSVRYITQKRLPDKALDLIDSSGAKAKLDGVARVNIDRLMREVSKQSLIPVEMISVKDNTLFKTLPDKMKKKVFGQDAAIDVMVDSIAVARTGMRDHKPIGNFLFVGPTGTGKTHICKTLANQLGVKLVRFDMSEYMEKHTVSKLIGAPPGYVGHGEGKMGEGQLIAEISNNPNCVLLLDEIEKAAPEVTQVLLQVMDDGRLTSSKGREVDFSNVILVMTSNLGAADADKQGIGFGASDYNPEAIEKAIKDYFPPEFRNRVDHIVTFDKLSLEEMKKIVNSSINDLNVKLSDKKVSVLCDSKAVEWLADKGYVPSMGARPLARLIQEKIKTPIAKEMLYGSLVNGGIVTVTSKGDSLVLSYSVAKQSVEV